MARHIRSGGYRVIIMWLSAVRRIFVFVLNFMIYEELTLLTAGGVDTPLCWQHWVYTGLIYCLTVPCILKRNIHFNFVHYVGTCIFELRLLLTANKINSNLEFGTSLEAICVHSARANTLAKLPT